MTIISSEANQAPDQKLQTTRNSGLLTGLHRVSKLLLALMVCLAGFVQVGNAQDYTFSTIGGVGGSPGNNNSNGGVNFPSVLFNFPTGVIVDSAGNLYVADTSNHVIRKVSPTGTVTTVVGQAGNAGVVDATGSAARLNSPEGPAIDASGNIYVADFNGHTIRKITSAGVVTTLAGVANTKGGVNGTGTAAYFNGPAGVAVDSTGNVYVADSNNSAIRKVTSAGVVTTLAGTIGTAGHTDGTGTAAVFNRPRGIAIDGSGNVYVADYFSHVIRKVTSAGVVTTLAGTAGTAGSADGTGTAATFNSPTAVAVDSGGNVYVADQVNHTIRKITSAGVVTTLAGTAGANGSTDGTGPAAKFYLPSGIAVDSSGNLYVTDYYNQTVRKVTSAGVVTTLAGTGGVSGYVDGSGVALGPSQFNSPTSLVVDGAGNIYIADTSNQLIRKMSSSGAVTTFAGRPGIIGFADGASTAATFNNPTGVTIGNAGNIYVTDSGSHIIRQLTPAGVVTTFAGTNATIGSTDANGVNASFDTPNNIAADSVGNLYVADYNNHTIRKISLAGDVTTFAGLADNVGSSDGAGSAARFDHPRGVATDNAGNVYVSDTGNNTIRKISPSGAVTTIAGSAGATGTTDGVGSAARFNSPLGLAIDTAGNIYVTDSNSSTIRKISAAGMVTTIGGTANAAGSVDGAGAAARFNHPSGVTVDAAGIIYITDNNNHTIRKGRPTGVTGGTGGGADGTGNGPGGNGSGGSGGGGSGGSNNPNTSPAFGFFLRPVGMAGDSTGSIYVADTSSHVIKKITTAGVVSVFAGKEGTVGSTDGTGTSATFNTPNGVTIDSTGNLYVSDTGNATIRKITSAGVVTTFAGSTTTRGNTDGTGTAATFSAPVGITVDTSGNVYVADSTNATIRKITSAAVVTTLAGAANQTGDADGTGAAARFNNPTGIVVTSDGILFVSDTYNNTIRVVTSGDGVVTTYAGSAGISGSFDGVGINALFNLPRGLTLDGGGGIYVADTGNNSIRRVTSARNVFTVAGFPGIAGYREGTGTNALFNQPEALIASSSGLVISDTGNGLIRQVLSNGTVTSPTLSNAPAGGGGGGGGGGGDSGGGGGGAPSVWFFIALSALGLSRRFLKRAS